ncbi:MAG: carbamate kinase [Candidatus Marinimicrobia bacterium]|nr:carbamate kinase [Candidatus Neomarinimicrobiota bacterium]
MFDTSKLVVIALGGNAIKQPDEEGTFKQQLNNVVLTAHQLVEMNRRGYKLILTHGNGPQAGNLLIQQEEGKALVPPQPLDVLGAMTQGQIGFMFQDQLQNAFRIVGKQIPIATVVTQVLVNKDDPDFDNPSKPVGPFYTKAEADDLRESKGYLLKEVKPGTEKSWRRVVPSPEPIDIIEAFSIKTLVNARVIVITAGGGGVPVIEKDNQQLRGVEAVIDKDKAGQVLAKVVDAHIFLILTDVENAFINFGQPDQKALNEVTVAKMEQHLADGQFLAGSMGPKVEACIRFMKSGGDRAIITSLNKAVAALEGKTGTRIVP